MGLVLGVLVVAFWLNAARHRRLDREIADGLREFANSFNERESE